MIDESSFGDNMRSFLDLIKKVVGQEQYDKRVNQAIEFYTCSNKSIYRESSDLLFAYIINCMSFENEDYILYNPIEYSRIYPVFLNLSNKLMFHSKIKNFDEKMKALCNKNEKNIDAILFEILTAFKYCELGYSVEFLKPLKGKPTPDMSISKNDQVRYVECKKFQRVNNYSYGELDAWYELSGALAKVPDIVDINGHFHIKFKEEITKTNGCVIKEKILKKLKKRSILKPILICNTPQYKITFRPISNEKFNVCIDGEPHLYGSAILEYLTGNYNYKYMYKLLSCGGYEQYPYVSELSKATIFSCHHASPISIRNRVQSIIERLSKASSQLSDSMQGNIHILIEDCQGIELFESKCVNNIRVMKNFIDSSGGVEHVFVHIAKHILPPNARFDVEETIQIFNHHDLAPFVMTPVWYCTNEMKVGYGDMLYE